jgi:hypothetical protein
LNSRHWITCVRKDANHNRHWAERPTQNARSSRP